MRSGPAQAVDRTDHRRNLKAGAAAALAVLLLLGAVGAWALARVTGDRSLLALLLQNLLSNAVKFHDPRRRPHIHVGAAQTDGLWRFTVTDNGIGIEPEYTERVFAIFQRLHSRAAYPGNGIGLAPCRKIVEFHGGTIGLDPEYQSGARFVFTLPALGAAAPPPAARGVSAP